MKENTKIFFEKNKEVLTTILVLLIGLILIMFLSFRKTPMYNIVFDSDGGTVVYTQVIAKGAKATRPVDPIKEGYDFDNWYINDKLFNFDTKIKSDITLKAKWNIKKFTVEFKTGTETINEIVLYNETVSEPETPVKNGYVFLGWYYNNKLFDFNTQITSNLTLEARWIQTNDENNVDYQQHSNGNYYSNNDYNGNVSNNSVTNSNNSENTTINYKVEHYLMDTSGNYSEQPNEVENLSTNIGNTVTPIVKQYDGFTSPNTQTIEIHDDTNIIIKYYYTRNKYTLTLDRQKGISEVIGSGEYYYEEEVNINVNIFEGYSFDYWIDQDGNKYNDTNIVIKIDLKNISLTAFATPNEDTKYIVKHYKMNLDGITYNKQEEEIFTGVTDTKVTPEVKQYDGFTSPVKETVNIDGDGRKIVEYYYKRNKYTLTLDKQKGISEVIGNGEYYYEEEVNISANIFEGYSFDYWIDQDGNKYNDVNTTIHIGLTNINLTAFSKTNEYVITYNLNYDNSIFEQIILYGDKINQPENPTRSGYDFIGWYTDSECLNRFDFSQPMSAENLTLYAKWEANKYVIIFNANGGQGTMDNQELSYDSLEKLNENKFTKRGYAFAGWALTENGSVKYKDKAEVKGLSENGDINLYAVWNAVTYSITYELNGGNLVTQNQKTYTIETEDIILNNPEKEGYIFLHWILEDGTILENGIIPKGTTGNLIINAIFKLQPYTIIFNANNGTNETREQSGDYGKEINLNKNEFTKIYTITYKYNYPEKEDETISINNVFLGWALTQDGEVVYKDEEAVQDIVNNHNSINLYAKWDNPTVNLSDLSRDNHAFGGWSTTTDKQDVIPNENYILTGDITLNAIWYEIPKIKSMSVEASQEINGKYVKLDDVVGSGDNAFYIKLPNEDTFINANTLKITTTIPVTLNKSATTNPQYTDFKLENIASNGMSGTKSLYGFTLKMSSTDGINWYDHTNGNWLLDDVSVSLFKKLYTSYEKPFGIVKGFGITEEGFETPHYVTNVIEDLNGCFYVFFKEEGAPDITVTFKHDDNDIYKITIPKGSLAPNIGEYNNNEVEYKFDGWYSDKDTKNKFDFSKLLYEDTEIYVKYINRMETSWYYNNENATSFYISNADELKGFEYLVNTKNINFSQKTINLDNDINLENEQWNPINNFSGTFNGNNYTISNLQIIDYMQYNYENVGFFGSISNAKINNLKFDNVNIEITSSSTKNIGSVVGLSNNSTIEKISVNNVAITTKYINLTDGGIFVSGVIGTANDGIISEVSSTNGEIHCQNYEFSGSIIGKAKGEILITNLYSDIKISGSTYAGGIIGMYINPINLLTMKYVLYVGERITTRFGGTYMGITSSFDFSGSFTEILRKVEDNSIHNSYDNDRDNNKSTWLFVRKGTTNSKGTQMTEEQLRDINIYSDWDSSIWNISDGEYPTLKWLY